MNEKTGIVVEESLIDSRILNDFRITKVRISGHEAPEDRWHLYQVIATEQEIDRLSKNIKESWYMHFWSGSQITAIFQNRIFEFDYEKKETWNDVIQYGLSRNIPIEQLDFPIEGL